MNAENNRRHRSAAHLNAELEITDIAFGGSGVGRVDGKAVFVPFAIDGERVRVRITREKKHLTEGEVVEVLAPSGNRVEPPCPYFGRCGGCAYQHMAYSHQLQIKQRQVEQILRRIGKLHEVPMQPIIPSPAEYGYRNRITVHAQEGVIGFFRRDKHALLDITHCPISNPRVNELLAELRHRRPRDGHYTLRVQNGARIFGQTNDAVAEALRNLVANLVPANQTVLIDAFCGAGFFAKSLLSKFDGVIGIDWDRFAIAEAAKNATSKETYIAGNVDAELAALTTRASTLIVDPPATGLTAAARAAIIASAARHFIYVSCNPATLARDLGELQSRLRIVSVTPLDMFPQTAEIEIAVYAQSRDQASA